MTCIVGLIDGDSIWMGGDSAGVANMSLRVRADEKVFRNGPMLMGFTSSFRMGQLLRYAFEPPLHDPKMDIDEYMTTTFIDAVRECLKAGGYAQKKDGVESGGTFLVGYHGKLFEVEDDYQVGKSLDSFAAVGCGDQIAMGALFATAKEPPRKRVETALLAAEHFSAGVRGPFTILKL